MRDVGVRRVVFISSGAVYGEQIVQPVKEDVVPNPRSPYAVSKLASEYYVRTIGGLWGIETVSLRVFNAYGPGQHAPAAHAPVVPLYLRQALQEGTLVIHGDGNQTRDYVYVDDVVNAMVTASSAPSINKLVINVGSGVETSMRELVRTVIAITGSHPEVVYNPRTEGGVSRLSADLTLAGHTLDYQPQVSLEQGLRLMLERVARAS
jgi:UDP-glucose 4-epimerase